MDLTGISTTDLERLRAALRSGRLEIPLSRLGLQGESLESLCALASDLNSAGREATLRVLDAVLRERSQRPAPVELVWTGPESRSSAARDTAAVLDQLFSGAERSILLAGFAFDHAEEVLRPLHEALLRGVTCRVFADGPVAADFLRHHWPFGPPFPDVYGFEPERGVFASLHAKCVVVDGRSVFVTSANFTDRGQSRNVEVGLLVDDVHVARTLEAQFVGGAWFSKTR